MTYNTERPKLELSEYGRHVQSMIEYAATVEDEVKRQELANAIIELMGQMNPHLRNVEEFRHKLWDHIIIMSNFTLKVKSPYPAPDREKLREKPKALPYPQAPIKERHYGKNVEAMITKAVGMEDTEKKMAYAEVIGNYMKLVHGNWNNEVVNNIVIFEDLERMSGGQLKLTEDSNLDLLAKPNRPQVNTGQSGGGYGQNQKRPKNKGQQKKNFKKRQK